MKDWNSELSNHSPTLTLPHKSLILENGDGRTDGLSRLKVADWMDMDTRSNRQALRVKTTVNRKKGSFNFVHIDQPLANATGCIRLLVFWNDTHPKMTATTPISEITLEMLLQSCFDKCHERDQLRPKYYMRAHIPFQRVEPLQHLLECFWPRHYSKILWQIGNLKKSYRFVLFSSLDKISCIVGEFSTHSTSPSLSVTGIT